MMIQHLTPENALIKYEQIQHLIAAHCSELGILAKWESELIQILDHETKPTVVILVEKKRITPRGYEYEGKMYQKGAHIGIYRSLLRELFRDFPEKREAIALAVRSRGFSRKYIAQSRKDLFAGKSDGWALKYSDTIVDGWYVDTNINRSTIRKLLMTAVRTAGLTWGSDVKVYWERSVQP